ncbi:hypothetical protein SAMN05443549_107118 [Flavobacterium fluvii]|uniref:MG2 domain-containing protein n=1 Tax=Flavobacterium fluvii TaxID=468056 RepID=A0A1M5N5L3_9FLAO|nr:hypothetical protein [Flavobacterium fluvii]SHG84838.1 hypothetical protein SAMN05443549_107118 [Flavobacterium fluvii]
MLEAFNRIKICSLLIVLSFGFSQAQNQKAIPDVEKIYLHTDNSRYFIGDNLYYKAYDVRASNNLLFDNSNILYVELISPDSKIIARNKTNIEMGLGHGDFQLTDSLGVKPGVYQLRAYTNWNRNFGEDFVFKKDIEIINVFESGSKIDKAQNSATAAENIIAEIKNPTSYRIDFFPEGGSLLENVASVVGFKAIDNNGKPIDIKGEIYDSDADDELVTSFSSQHDGMGKFQMIPMEGKNYYAKIKTPDGKLLHQELPKSAKKGYLLSFRIFKGKNILSICTNNATLAQNPDGVLTLVCKAKGISYLETKQTLRVTELSFELPKEIFPEGISQITILDSDNKPQSERLVYFEKEHDLGVQLTTDKASYQPNEKATINLSSKSKEGIAKSGSFSLSVTDTNGVDEKDLDTTISSYFLMESDIRGKVHNPGYYFDTANSKRLEHLENLLLTQGWRDFVWKTIPEVDDKLGYKVEKGITITGRVKQLFGRKPLINTNMTLALMGNKKHGIFNATTDSMGRFKYENLLFSGKTKMYLNTRDEKGKFKGEIVLDSIEQPPMAVFNQKESISLPESTNKFVENVYKKFTFFGVKPENVLKEVVIVAEKKNPAITRVPYINPSYTYKADKNTASYYNVFDVIQDFRHFAKSGMERIYTFTEGEFFDDPAGGYFIDGNETTFAEVYAISPYEIEQIDFVEVGIEPGIYIFTNRYKNLGKPKKANFQSIKKEIDGFYTARVFYSPNPEQAELDKKAATRNTLYWNPDMYPDKTGNASVNYYNTKVETKVKVALEGITATGIPVVRKTYYTIKN